MTEERIFECPCCGTKYPESEMMQRFNEIGKKVGMAK